jgi:methionine--tRNA ligase beta chain
MGRDDSITPAGLKPAISREDVEKLDVRIGAFKRVEAVPKSEKLPKLTVNFGNHSRQILVGMKGERTDLEGELLGRQALFIINLPPRKMAGEVSEVGVPAKASSDSGMFSSSHSGCIPSSAKVHRGW